MYRDYDKGINKQQFSVFNELHNKYGHCNVEVMFDLIDIITHAQVSYRYIDYV